ncbi:MAG: BatA and WFA domain-containing protein [Acidobacteria bacterium]|nr:BatA and WFA domain-containing protein [Acidobacteriota bacterium]
MDFLSTWWVAWMGAGAAAAAIPVVIHMIHTAKAPDVPFPTLRFLKSAAEKTARRRKIENLFLMILRMLLFAFLAFALSQPFLKKDYALFGGKAASAAVIVLDNSYSMNVRHEQATRFAKAKQEARAILESPWQPAEAAVLLTNPRTDPVPRALSGDRADLFRRIDDARLASEKADLVGALKTAYALLDKAQSADKRLWIVTDRQALSWQGLKEFDEPRQHPDVPVAVIRPTEPAMTNLAVTGVEVVSRSRVVGLPVRFDVMVRNSGPAPEKRNLLLFVDDFGQPRLKQPVDLTAAGTPGADRMVSLTHVFEKPGPHQVLVALEGSDSLDVDDSRRVALSVADRIPVLVVKQRAGDVPFQDANFYLVRALDPVGTGGDFPWAIKPTEVTADQFEAEALDKYDVVFLNNVSGLRAAAAKALADYVARGRTLVVFAGPEVVPDAYNRLFIDGVPRQGGLLPARLKERVGDAVLKTTVEKITQVQGQSPYMQDLVDSADIYQDVLVYEYLRTDGAPADAVLARLSSGDPFLVAKDFGRGRVLLFTTAATTDWSTFPIRNLFLPLMMRIVHLASRDLGLRQNLLAGQPFEMDFYPDVRQTTLVEITGPLGPSGETASEAPQTTLTEGHNILRFDKTWNLGYYGYRLPQGGAPPGVFATNPDGAESELAEVADGKLVADLGAREVHMAPSLAELVSQFEDTARRELWQYFLMICLVLAVCEPLIANWMRPEHRRETAHPTVRHSKAA